MHFTEDREALAENTGLKSIGDLMPVKRTDLRKNAREMLVALENALYSLCSI